MHDSWVSWRANPIFKSTLDQSFPLILLVCRRVLTGESLSQRASDESGVLVVNDPWGERISLFFSTLHFYITSILNAALLTHLMPLCFYPISLHSSVCPCSFTAFFPCPHCSPLYPNHFPSHTIPSPSNPSLIPLRTIFLSNSYSCNFYMAAWSCCWGLLLYVKGLESLPDLH